MEGKEGVRIEGRRGGGDGRREGGGSNGVGRNGFLWSCQTYLGKNLLKNKPNLEGTVVPFTHSHGNKNSPKNLPVCMHTNRVYTHHAMLPTSHCFLIIFCHC